MKAIKVLAGLVSAGSVVAAIFFGIQYMNLNSENSSLKNEVSGFDQTLADLNEQISTLETLNESYSKRNSELVEEKTELQEQLLTKALEIGTLRGRVQNLEREIERLNEPPVSPDASTPWERLQHSFELWKQGKWDKYWELLDSGFKGRCSKENFIAQMLIFNPTLSEKVVFIDQEIGRTRATVWLSINGRGTYQRFFLENGEWMIYGGNVSC